MQLYNSEVLGIGFEQVFLIYNLYNFVHWHFNNYSQLLSILGFALHTQKYIYI